MPTDTMTPAEAREWAASLLEGTTPGQWIHAAALSPDGVDDYRAVEVMPSGAPDDGGDLLARVHSSRSVDAGLMAAAPDLAREVIRLASMLEERQRAPVIERIPYLDTIIHRTHADLDRLAIAYGRAALAHERDEARLEAADRPRSYIATYHARQRAMAAVHAEAARLAGYDHD